MAMTTNQLPGKKPPARRVVIGGFNITLLILYSIGIAFLTFITVLFLGTYIGGTTGPGDDGTGYVIVGIYILCGTLVGCTYAIIQTIRRKY